MESLTAEGRAIFDTISSNAEVNNERQKKEIGELIVRAVNAAMDSTIWANIDKVVAYRQVYADGVESMLHQHISELRKQIGFTTRSNEPESSKKCRRVTRRPAQRGAILLRLHGVGGRPCGLLPLHPASGKSTASSRSGYCVYHFFGARTSGRRIFGAYIPNSCHQSQDLHCFKTNATCFFKGNAAGETPTHFF